MDDNVEESGSLLLNLVSEDYRKKKREIPQKFKDYEEKTNPNVLSISKQKQLTNKESNSIPNSTKGKSLFVKKVSSSQHSFEGNSKEKGNQKNVSNKKSDQLVCSSLFTCNPVAVPLTVKKQESVSEPLFSTKTFDEIDLHSHLVSCLKNRLEIVKMTKVQEQTIPLLLKGQDALVKSCTGSGKTLAYAIPIVQKLQQIEPKIKRSDGVYALVVTPTRELALQCFDTFSTLTKAFTWIVPGYLIGGEKKKSEKARLRKGINILISTPGRLLDHLEHTKCISLRNIAWLVIDEADKLLEQVFEDDITRILSYCYENRQSTLLSATLSKGVENLAGVTLTNPVHVDISAIPGQESSESFELIVPANLKQYIVVVPAKQRLIVLSSFIIANHLKGNFKGLIFMCSQSTVDFHHALLSDVLATFLMEKGARCRFFKLQGSMRQEERTEIFNRYKSVKDGILLCTDVAARGLDLPYVDWIVQYTAPVSAELYVHRVGRTARIGKKGSSLLFLMPTEIKFSSLLSEHKINFEEISVDEILQSLLLLQEQLTFKGKCTVQDCATTLQTKYENTVYSEKDLHNSAKEAFASYIQSYASYPKSIRDALPFRAVHLGHIAKSFCLREAPSKLGSVRKSASKSFNSKIKGTPKTRPPMKRKRPTNVSEFDSGFSSLKFQKESERNSKKKKH